MTAGRVVVAVALVVLALAGCGGSGNNRTPNLARLPLAPGTQILARVRQCDPGSHAYCAIELVVVDPAWRDAGSLVVVEKRTLARKGWTADHSSLGNEDAAESPGDKLRITYATADADLRNIELGWIKRSHAVSVALSRTLFDDRAAMSMELEIGS
jgi:hypothetical protein